MHTFLNCVISNFRSDLSSVAIVRNSEVMYIHSNKEVAVTSGFIKKSSEITPRFQNQRYFKFPDSASDPRTKQGGLTLEVRI